MRSLRTKTRIRAGEGLVVVLVAALLPAFIACSGADGELFLAPSGAAAETDAALDVTSDVPPDGSAMASMDGAGERRLDASHAKDANGARDATEVTETSAPLDARADGESTRDARADAFAPDAGVDAGTDGSDGKVPDAGVADAGASDGESVTDGATDSATHGATDGATHGAIDDADANAPSANTGS